MAEKLPSYGGQAVIEGVMMRGSSSVAIAMRSPDKSIVIHSEPLSGIYKSKIIKIPFLRGLVALWDALGLGLRALTISANLQSGEEEKLEGWKLYLTLGFSLSFGVALFLVLIKIGLFNGEKKALLFELKNQLESPEREAWVIKLNKDI